MKLSSNVARRSLIIALLLLIYGKLKAKKQEKKVQISDKRTLVAFTGSGVLFPYYLGFLVYLKSTFQLENVRFAGISGGSLAVVTMIALDLPVELSFQILAQVYDRCRFWIGLIDKYRWIAIFTSFAKRAGRSKVIRAMEFGVSACTLPPTSHWEPITPGQSVDDAVTIAQCSCSVFPFWRTLTSVYKGKRYADGFVTFMKKPPHDPDRTLSVSVYWPWSDVYYRCNPFLMLLNTNTRHWIENVVDGFIEAKRNHDLFLRKGLIMKSQPISITAPEIRSRLTQMYDWFEKNRDKDDCPIWPGASDIERQMMFVKKSRSKL